jgi:hypothetical protein
VTEPVGHSCPTARSQSLRRRAARRSVHDYGTGRRRLSPSGHVRSDRRGVAVAEVEALRNPTRPAPASGPARRGPTRGHRGCLRRRGCRGDARPLAPPPAPASPPTALRRTTLPTGSRPMSSSRAPCKIFSPLQIVWGRCRRWSCSCSCSVRSAPAADASTSPTGWRSCS